MKPVQASFTACAKVFTGAASVPSLASLPFGDMYTGDAGQSRLSEAQFRVSQAASHTPLLSMLLVQPAGSSGVDVSTLQEAVCVARMGVCV